MTNRLRKNLFAFVAISLMSILLFSCEYETPVRDAEYPEQTIYMPAAANGFFMINDISRKIGELPFDGNPYRYLVDLPNKKFVIPLSVYRAGIDNKGAFKVNIAINADTILTLREENKVPWNAILLPDGKYSIVNSVEMKNGEEVAPFDLLVDLDFLRENYPDKLFILGVSISSQQRKTNPKLSTTVVMVDTKIIKPTADFTFEVKNKEVIFTNNSLMSENYSWDFGDGNVSNENSPSHVYSSSGVYTVTLTSVGITGEEDKSVKSIKVTIP